MARLEFNRKQGQLHVYAYLGDEQKAFMASEDEKSAFIEALTSVDPALAIQLGADPLAVVRKQQEG